MVFGGVRGLIIVSIFDTALGIQLTPKIWTAPADSSDIEAIGRRDLNRNGNVSVESELLGPHIVALLSMSSSQQRPKVKSKKRIDAGKPMISNPNVVRESGLVHEENDDGLRAKSSIDAKHDVGFFRQHLTASSAFSSLMTVPLAIAKSGGPLLLKKVRIAGNAVKRAMQGSQDSLTEGDLVGVVYATTQAITIASKENDALTNVTSVADFQCFGILLVCILVIVCWSAEAIISKHEQINTDSCTNSSSGASTPPLATQHWSPLSHSRKTSGIIKPPVLGIKQPFLAAPRPNLSMLQATVEVVPDITETAEERSHGILRALSFARFAVAWHVVLDNYFMRGDGQQTSDMGKPWVVFARWGVTAVPWFFIVSGFSHTYSKMVGLTTYGANSKDRDEDFFAAMLRRVAVWYPMYAVTLTWCAARLWSIEAEDWSHYVANMMLINGVMWHRDSFPFVVGDWWLSFLMIYLLTWAPMLQVLSTSSNSVLRILFTIAFVVAIPSAVLEWYCNAGSPLFQLFQYWPSFLFGQALAMWFVRNNLQQKAVAHRGPGTVGSVYVLRPVHELPLACRLGATVSLLVLGLFFFSFSPYDRVPFFDKPITPLLLKGGLVPLQGLMIVGLASECDPMAKLFARRPFCYADRLPLTTFIFQVPIHNFIQDLSGLDGMTWAFSITLFLFSILSYELFEKPWRSVMRMREK